MATLSLNAGGIFTEGSTEYYILGSGTSGSGTFASPWIVNGGDTVAFGQANALGTGTAFGFALFTNNNIINFSSTIQNRTVATGSASTDGFSWQGSNYYIRRENAASDTTPDQFTFNDVTGVSLSTQQTSNTVTITGIDTATNVSVSGGTWNKNGGVYSTAPGTVVNNDQVAVRHTSSSSANTAVNTTLDVGGVTDTFTSTTGAAPDSTPDQFTFNDDLTGVPLSSTQTSNQITITGINTSAVVTVSGGLYSKNGGTYTGSSGSAVNGDTFRVRHTASGSYSTDTNTTLTVGGVSDTYTTRTEAEPDDSTPDQFTFSDLNGVTRSQVQTSNTITILDINQTVNVSVSGGTYSKNSGGYTSSAGTAVNGDQFSVRHTSSANYNTNTNTTLTVGGVNDTFTTLTESEFINSDHGIEVYSTGGSIAFTTADNLATYFAGGTFTITNGNSLGPFVSVPGLLNNEYYSIFILVNEAGTLYGQEAYGVLTQQTDGFRFQRTNSSGTPFTAGDASFYYTVVKTS